MRHVDSLLDTDMSSFRVSTRTGQLQLQAVPGRTWHRCRAGRGALGRRLALRGSRRGGVRARVRAGVRLRRLV